MPPTDPSMFNQTSTTSDMASMERSLALLEQEGTILRVAANRLQAKHDKAFTDIHTEQLSLSEKIHAFEQQQRKLDKSLNAAKQERQAQRINDLQASNQLYGMPLANIDDFEYNEPANQSPSLGKGKRKHGADSVTPGDKRPVTTIIKPSVMAMPDFNSAMNASTSNAPTTKRPKQSHPPAEITEAKPTHPQVTKVMKPLAALDDDDAEDTVQLEEATEKTQKEDKATKPTKSAVEFEHVDIVVDETERTLAISSGESKTIQDAWIRDSAGLQDVWTAQLKKFDDKDGNWLESVRKLDAAKKGSCVRCCLFQAGKCHKSLDDALVYACKTCWNTNSVCVGWDVGTKEFYLKQQLPKAKSETNAKPDGPFDATMYLSGNTKIVRTDVPPHWEKR